MPTNIAEPNIESLERMFQVIAEAPKYRQESLLAELCPDLEAQEVLRNLLKSDSSDELIIDKVLFPSSIELSLGEQIGCYKLLQKIGEGGMGIVYMAEQSVPVRRKVALKVIKPGADSKQVLARFNVERQALSMMEHPNIAKVFDAGATKSGRPFFVMELVKGRSIIQYCLEQQLPIRKKLELMITVCHAIQHAHQKGIIHRDLKPSNVLVTEYDGQPVAKVIDFGVAKAGECPLTEITMFTGFGQIIGTLEYMSPEQSRMNQLDVDVRTDVYSLGVLLYELITGSTPILRERLRSAEWEQMLRIIREEDPPLPSTRLSDLELASDVSQGSSLGKSSQAERHRLSKLVKGELDWIVMKSLEKERARRYATPGEMAKDIQCYLNGDFVAACPPSMIYRLQKTFKRNKLAILTSGLVAVALVLGLAGTTWQAWRATKAERNANLERELAKQQAEKALRSERIAQEEYTKMQLMTDFLRGDLLGMEQGSALQMKETFFDRDITFGQLLDRARDRLKGKDYEKEPNRKRAARIWLLKSYFSIGRLSDATTLCEEIYVDVKALTGDQSINAIEFGYILAGLYRFQDRLWDALPLYEKTYTHKLNSVGASDLNTVNALDNLAKTLWNLGLYQQAFDRFQEELAIVERVKGDKSSEVARIQAWLGGLLVRLGQTAEADELMLQAIATYRQQQNTLNLQEALSKYGRACLRLGRFGQAKSALAEACNLGNQRGFTGGERAELQFVYAVACLMAPSSETHVSAPMSIEDSLASLMKHSVRATAPAVDELQLLANCLQRNGKFDQSEQLLSRALAVLNRHQLHGTRRSAILADLAEISQQRGDYIETKNLLLQAVDSLGDKDKYPSEYNQTPEFKTMNQKFFGTLAARLVQVFRELGDYKAAEDWQAMIVMQPHS